MELFDDEIEEEGTLPVVSSIAHDKPPAPEPKAAYPDDDEEPQLPDWYMEWYVPEAIRYCIEHSWGREDEPPENYFVRVGR